MTHGGHTVRLIRVGAAVTVLALATACGSSGDDKPDEPKASATQGKEQKERAEAERAALAAYRGMWDAQVEGYSSGSMEDAKLGDYTTGEAAKKIINVFTYYRENGLTLTGEPTLKPKVTALDVTSDASTATISDCVDTTDYVLVKRATGEPVTVDDKGTRQRWTASASTAESGGSEWRITDYTVDKDRTC